ncbi:outer membrane beta-barrel protein [Pedobacter ginsengisoli]|uniref:outer membrane beta-barrel protein n=1 Tax=Pedobacter ginsengisoli TaxID=363852 RepID=UPI00254E04AC|nr:outer membrane beta-barrel protein [Pedobacter ginsengisoli]
MIRFFIQSVSVALLGLILFCGTARSQEKRVSFMLGAGMTYNSFYSKHSRYVDGSDFGGEYEFIWSYYAEGIVDINLKNSFALRTGLKYIGKGARPEEFVSGSYRSQYKDEKLFMLEVPVNLVRRIKLGNRALVLSGGLFGGFMVSGMKKYQNGYYDRPYDPDAPYLNVYKDFELGLNLKTEYEFMENTFVGVGYEVGLLNLIKPSNSGTIRTQAFTFGLGYRFW